MLLAGLTGGIASGKSAVAARLVEHGAELIDADAIAREVVLPGTPTWKKIVEHFGESVLDPDGFIDRPALGRVVFGSSERRALLNELTHPPVIAEVADQLELLACFDGVVVLDVPLLVEAGVDPSRAAGEGAPRSRPSPGYDAVIVVATKPETQLRRLLEERRMAEEDARARIAAQAPLEQKLAVATHVIWNEGTLAELYAEVDEVADDLLRRAREKAAAEEGNVPDD